MPSLSAQPQPSPIPLLFPNTPTTLPCSHASQCCKDAEEWPGMTRRDSQAPNIPQHPQHPPSSSNDNNTTTHTPSSPNVDTHPPMSMTTQCTPPTPPNIDDDTVYACNIPQRRCLPLIVDDAAAYPPVLQYPTIPYHLIPILWTPLSAPWSPPAANDVEEKEKSSSEEEKEKTLSDEKDSDAGDNQKSDDSADDKKTDSSGEDPMDLDPNVTPHNLPASKCQASASPIAHHHIAQCSKADHADDTTPLPAPMFANFDDYLLPSSPITDDVNDLQGTSCTMGGFTRGKGHGVADFNLVPVRNEGRVLVYKNEDRTSAKARAVRVPLAYTLGPVLKAMVKKMTTLADSDISLWVKDDWEMKGPFAVAVEGDEPIE
ncbi:hypothetical protein BDN71DRAFT_1431401 [Pleurotus eryngii]|uniref:Uncharacterized protein n=1 Tax=Pleurotus eryngii TaxID=5323 RepID=A0A9P5ZXG9_PLEER|nr:hypothetical protein BDN71DRAFT_1431401 [Pleurotus eryngii]